MNMDTETNDRIAREQIQRDRYDARRRARNKRKAASRRARGKKQKGSGTGGSD